MKPTALTIDFLISQFQSLGWKAEPMKLAMQLAREHPEAIADLAIKVIDHLPQGGTFLDAALSFLPDEHWPRVISHAIQRLENDQPTGKLSPAAESVISYASLQCVADLHPYLSRLFALDGLFSSYYGTYPWRDSGESHFETLREAFEHEASPTHKKGRPLVSRKELRAWRAMLETRHLPTVAWAVQHADRLSFSPQTVQNYLSQIEFEMRDGALTPLRSEKTWHLTFEKDYIPPRPKHLGASPTWDLRGQGEPQRFGGEHAEASCHVCGRSLHHLLTLSPVPEGLGVSVLSILTLATCLSCLGWEESPLCYRHDSNGLPSAITPPSEIREPQFPSSPLQRTSIRLIETPPRWQRQDWSLSNGRENLHRLGGIPSWVQDAEYPICPCCQKTMPFLLQLDSGLPVGEKTTGAEALTLEWGSGGLLYGFWCDGCRASAFLWQCT
ncbi:hypothetical protein EON80_10440 [bacterium]|nr:MAG: hypothetical protein EON80_10440 [bacterium]